MAIKTSTRPSAKPSTALCAPLRHAAVESVGGRLSDAKLPPQPIRAAVGAHEDQGKIALLFVEQINQGIELAIVVDGDYPVDSVVDGRPLIGDIVTIRVCV